MAANSFTATVRSRARSTTPVIDMSGEIDASAEEALDRAYQEVTALGGPAVHLNFTDVRYINSTGIALIVGLLARARKDHREVTAYGLSEHYRDIFQITRLADFVRLFPDEASAVAAAPAAT
jgi:anti-anti-sigma factor